MRGLAGIPLLVWALAAHAGDADVCPSARPAPLLHPRGAAEHAFQRLPRRMGVETLRLRDGFATTLLREGCETFAVTFDVGTMPAHADAVHLRETARGYMQRLQRVDPGFWLAKRFLSLRPLARCRVRACGSRTAMHRSRSARTTASPAAC